ncbi:hypothetical protein CAPTEDRAFT_206780 [Capitella teleta]|uniref:Prokineticin domain-containing protein n=1 Tax=Capitella teleta TaxID=283909 RepID=R7UDW7_CAPTE|nr:hypothetical protein CAPTEDRAFT_206780 [Capitella teleta]|eukprot:ELU01432.1 hypothetical protein CAPTEDRAFT_206780 [Capitella teleta]
MAFNWGRSSSRRCRHSPRIPSHFGSPRVAILNPVSIMGVSSVLATTVVCLLLLDVGLSAPSWRSRYAKWRSMQRPLFIGKRTELTHHQAYDLSAILKLDPRKGQSSTLGCSADYQCAFDECCIGGGTRRSKCVRQGSHGDVCTLDQAQDHRILPIACGCSQGLFCETLAGNAYGICMGLL